MKGYVYMFERLMYGGDYNPEQWLTMPEILERDIELFKEAKINTVSVGIFSWAKLEPEEGKYDMDWLVEIVDHLYENGISVILATPSGARPHWMSDKYPEVLRVNDKGQRNQFGGRHNHCLTSPVYRDKVYKINSKLVEVLGDHPAVKMWHISNELGGDCHCELCQNSFRDWLKKKYHSIDELNDRWCTTFWSHTYTDFEQIEAPSSIGESMLMALNLDWKRFVSDQTIDFVKTEIKAIKDAGNTKPITTNMMYHFEGIDYFKLAKELDVVSWDSYPLWHKKPDYEIAVDNGFWHDVIRGLKKKPYLLMESSPSSTNWQGVSKLRKPGVLEAAALQSIAHGADGSLFFQMRQSRGASEKFHGAVIDHYGGNDTRVFREVCKTGQSLQDICEVMGTNCASEVAILFDWDNIWALKDSQGPRNDGLHFEECVEKSYRAFRKMGLNVDIIEQKSEIDDYKIVVAPMQYLFHEGFTQKVRKYVEAGGTFVMTYWSGVVDETDRCYLGGRPYDLMDVFGLRAEEIDGLYDWESNSFVSADGEEKYTCKYLCDIVKPTTAEILYTYGKDFYAGTPAATVNRFGKGKAYYICADVEEKFYDDFYRQLVADQDVERIYKEDIPSGVEVTGRCGCDHDYIFIQNYNAHEVTVALPKGEVILGNTQGILAPYDSVIIKCSR